MNTDNSRRSGAHRQVEDILRTAGLSFESEREFGIYTVDIYFPEFHIGVEVDGPGHLRKHDTHRDGVLLKEHGLYILRVKHDQDKGDIEQAVFDFIDQHYVDSDVRKTVWRQHA